MKTMPQEIKRRYRNNVLRKRLQAGFKTQKGFAESLGICPSVLCQIESDKRFLSAPIALRITEVLECKLDDLFIKRENR